MVTNRLGIDFAWNGKSIFQFDVCANMEVMS